MRRAALEVVGSFVSAINGQNLTLLHSLMTPDHVFTDARGTRFVGADVMIENWKSLFHAYPQYWISIDSNFAEMSRVALFGTLAGKWRVNGTVIPGSWKVNAAWLAAVDNGKVRSWSIFCDTAWTTPPQQKVEVAPLAILEI